jgi:site-specific recombinase XerD
VDDYKKYESDCERIRRENIEILKQFANWLQDKQLSERTIYNHVSNIDFFANEFLLYEEAIEAKDGASHISMFLGYWFIRKAMWSSVSQIKSYVASFKKFYTFMCEKGYIKQEQLEDMKDMIKEEMPEWIETMKRYDEQGSLY